MIRRLALSVCFAMVLAASAAAHHNMSALFDFSQRFTSTGTLTKVDWRNPHIYVFVDVKNDKGQVETWSFEGPSPGFFRQREVGKENFESSMQKSIKVEASRARDGSHSGLIREITLADGKLVSACPQNC
jgi:hypothetical protein